MAKTGEIRLRRIEDYDGGDLGFGIAVEIRGSAREKWNRSSIYPVMSAQKGANGEVSIPTIFCGIEEEVNKCLDLGYQLVPCYEHEWDWERPNGVTPKLPAKNESKKKVDKGEER